MEEKMMCLYVRYTSPKILATEEKISYYYCHRSGDFDSQSKGKRSLKGLGSNKIFGHCPSTMTVKISNDVTVNFCGTHYGHEDSLGRVPVSKEQKAKIAGKYKFKIIFILLKTR